MKYNFLVFFMLIFSLFLVLTVNSWLSIWINMEMNLIMFINLIIMNNYNIYDYSMKYFLLNSFSSSIFIFFMNLNFVMSKNLMIIVMLIMMMIKLGIFPFYNWFINLMENLNWSLCFILMTIQKVIPLYVMLLMNFINKFNLVILMNSIISVLIIFNSINLKYILGVSSMNHMSWLLYSINFSENLFMLYLISYILLNYSLIYMMKIMNLNYLIDILKFFKIKFNIYYIMMILSLMSFPPFFGFLMKWFYFYKILLMSYFYLFMLMMLSLIFMYYYIRLILFMLMMNFIEMKFMYMMIILNFKLNLNLNFKNLLMLNSLMNLFMIMIWLY